MLDDFHRVDTRMFVWYYIVEIPSFTFGILAPILFKLSAISFGMLACEKFSHKRPSYSGQIDESQHQPYTLAN